MGSSRGFKGCEYLDALRRNYPSLLNAESIDTIDEKLHAGFVKQWSESEAILGVDAPDRFQRLCHRAFSSRQNAWSSAADWASEHGLRRLAASTSYKGLIHLKPPCDIVLYASLIWELRPATIIEFGALQGGSTLWLADQADACGLDCEVHSFELLEKCIHPQASHRRVHFHKADLRDLNSLDLAMFHQLPHPWLVIDDAHENLSELMSLMGGMLLVGDYYVVEDVLLYPTAGNIQAWVTLCEQLNFLVDSKYTDAFGYNVTCAPNGWLTKIE